jgi:hypothetical protein
MLLRVTVVAALVALPLGMRPSQAAAQERGLDRAVVASARAAEAPGQAKNHPGRQDKSMPPGIAKRFPDGETLPRGIERTRGPSAPAVEPQPEPEPEPDTGADAGVCMGGLLFVGGVPTGPC